MQTDSAELSPDRIAAQMDGRLRAGADGRLRAFLPSPCIQNHAANLALLPDGRLACVWFGGTMEGMGDISVWMSTLDGERWQAPVQMSDAPDRSEQNPVLFTAPGGAVWLFHTSQPGGRQDLCEIMARVSTDGGTSFGPPRRVGDFRGIFVRQPPRIGPQGMMRELDQRSHRDICELYDWVSRDAFWCANVLSPQKLRQKWDQLQAKRGNPSGGHQRPLSNLAQAQQQAQALRAAGVDYDDNTPL